jgi:hypothetical protein
MGWLKPKNHLTLLSFNAEGLGAAGVIYFANYVPSVASIRSAVLLYTVNSQYALANYCNFSGRATSRLLVLIR